MLQLIVPNDHPAIRLDQFLAQQLNDLSRSRLQQLILEGHVVVNEKKVRASHKLVGGEKINIEIPKPLPLNLIPQNIPLDILYEDEHLLAINKPPGLVVHPGAGQQTHTLVHALLHHCRDLSGIGGVLRPGIVHRLDKGTSGVMVIAKNDQAHVHLANQFAKREALKYYVAFVYGTPKNKTGTIETFFGRHKTARQKFTGKLDAGKRAVTVYELLNYNNDISELGVLLKTGRTHQIRVHLAEFGLPIIGDPLYGQPKRVPTVLQASIASLKRQALHAVRLEILHPKTLQKMVLSAPLCPDLAFLAKAVRVPAGLI